MNKLKFAALFLTLTFMLSACNDNNVNETVIEQTTQEETLEETTLEETNEEPDNDESDDTTEETTHESQVNLNDINLDNYRQKDDTLLTINGEEISYSKFYNFFDLYSSVKATQENLVNDLTSMFVRDRIITQELQEAGIEVTDVEIQEQVDQFVVNLGGEEQFKDYLSILGTDINYFRENLEKSIAADKHLDHFIENFELSDDEINLYYEQNKDMIDNVLASHILVEDEETANTVLERLNNDEDFAQLAEEFSIDEAANANGGSLGRINRTGFDEDFVNAAFELEDGEISDPVQTQFGYHIIKVDENSVGVDNNREDISRMLSSQTYNEEMAQKIQEANVEYND